MGGLLRNSVSMSKSERLLSLLQALRAYRRPVSAERLASELNVSIRTIYRDVVSLNAQGATIEGEAGIGYVLRPGFLLPPLMFDDEEIEALVLGSRWVMQRGDKPLANAARNALTKIATVLPEDLKERVELAGVVVGASREAMPEPIDLAPIRAVDPRGAQGQDRLQRREGPEVGARDLADRARLLRPRARWSRPGARCARISATSAPTASRRPSR